ncbi:hypothetical protein LTR84_011227 [Exophiala bonariae]|uniref:Uncharacterized protein n=1 Tax=Exophiala bonariae TaxID=1690606 RepID=A0AAV9NL56_9EURO|nr:hypothetical protein LTR84_011227 [Exophiala bonariae]
MPNLVFIDALDNSRNNQIRVKRHVANATHKRKRLANVIRHRTAGASANRHTTPIGALDDVVEDEEPSRSNCLVKDTSSLVDGRNASSKARRKQETKAVMLRWRLPVPQDITPRGDQLKIELVLTQSCNWMFGQYTYPWSILIKRDPTVYDQNNRIEIFREAFYIVSDLISSQRVDAAFKVLKSTLDAVPGLFRDSHPEILFSLVELASGINMPGADALHAKVKVHIADMAEVVLGVQHPLTILLRSEFDAAPRSHVTELVFKCIIDALSKTFGQNAYQTLVQQMGRSQFYARTGRGRDGQELITRVMKEWQGQYGSDSVLARLAELELNLMRLQECHDPDSSVEAETNNSMLRIEVMTGVYTNKFTERPTSTEAKLDRSSRTLALAHWFLLKKRYTFALHVYGRRSGQSAEDCISTPDNRDQSLADKISDIVEEALSEILFSPGNISMLPLRASFSDERVSFG